MTNLTKKSYKSLIFTLIKQRNVINAVIRHNKELLAEKDSWRKELISQRSKASAYEYTVEVLKKGLAMRDEQLLTQKLLIGELKKSLARKESENA